MVITKFNNGNFRVKREWGDDENLIVALCNVRNWTLRLWAKSTVWVTPWEWLRIYIIGTLAKHI